MTRRAPIDQLAVEFAVAGHSMYLRPIERRAAVAELRRRGLERGEIAVRLHCHVRTVERHITALRRAGLDPRQA
jgi:DNA-binding NarL/FixJ family response regulator